METWLLLTAYKKSPDIWLARRRDT